MVMERHVWPMRTSAKVVYFVRHGQSEDNVAPVFQSPDSPLSAVGRNQAARIAARGHTGL